MRFSAALTLILLLAASAEAALDPAKAGAEYERMQKRLYSTNGAPIPAGGITITRDTATWTFTRGTIHLAEPDDRGHVAGFVFEGEGRFTMTIPDPVERGQLRRFAERDIEGFDEPFTEMVARFSDDTIDKLFPNAPTGGSGTTSEPTKRSELVQVEW